MSDMPIRTRKIEDFPEPYRDLWAEIRINVPMRVVHQLEAAGYDNTYAALEQFIAGWNFPDDAGQPLPVPATREVLEQVPVDLFLLLQERIWRELKSPLPETSAPPS
jgi:hypothetical protein